MDIDKKRSQIKEIQNNNDLTPSEKSKQIQKIMGGYDNFNMNDNINIINCEHYPHKKCNKFYFSCCNAFFSCIRCHNGDHETSLKYIACGECKLLQVPSNVCCDPKCNLSFSKNYCSKCFIWTEKSIVHCDECGICRVGEVGSLFHCNNCDACFDVKGKDFHKCINISYREQVCTYCLESTHSSQDSSVSLKCGHLVHNKCLQSAIKSGVITCPTCRKSMYDVDWSLLKHMINMQPMIEEDIYIGDVVKCLAFGGLLFRVDDIGICALANDGIGICALANDDISLGNMYKGCFVSESSEMIMIMGTFNRESLEKPLRRINIYCNDCCVKSNVEFHYLGHECNVCGGYNTSLF